MGQPVVGPAVRLSRAGVRLGLCASAIALSFAGCGAVPAPGPQTPAPTNASPPPAVPSPDGSPSPSGSAIPVGGVSLAAFGIRNGPAQFSIPRGSLAASVVDQPNNVVLVLSAPPATEVAGYLQQTLPGSGFTLTDTDPDDGTFTFDGYGWTGSFTTGDGVSAVLLRPR